MKLNGILFAAFAMTVSLGLSSCSKNDKDSENEGYCMQYKNLEIKSEYVEGGVVKYNALTPPNFDPNGNEKYCVIYLLHGAGDDNTAWLESPQSRGGTPSLATQMYSALKENKIPRTVIFMPDGKMSFYMNSFEEFFFKEFMPTVEKQFGIDSRRECRAVAGLSMGGFGSAYYGLKYPDKFCYVYTMSQAAMEPLYSLVEDADKAKLPYFTIVNGLSDATVGKSPDNFYEYAKNKGVNCEFENWMGGHDWKFWGECIPKFLSKIGSEFKKNR